MRHAASGLAAALLAAAASLGALAALAADADAQDPPPHGEWLTFDTPHFRVTYQPPLESLARHAADVAERTHAILREELVRAPRGRTDLVVTDHVDLSNGFATPFTTNRVVVFARPPVGSPGLAFTRDWIEMVVAHEVVHIFHLEHAGRVGRAVRSVFGRVPMVWPLFPALSTPTWNIEGLATYYESRLTGAGRTLGSYHDMVVRMAALEDRIPRLRDVSAPSPVWPGGERSYIYGAALMAWIADRHGVDAHAALLDATYGAVIPTFLAFDPVARRTLDTSFGELYEAWRVAATDSARALEARLASQGLTATTTIVDRGPHALAPRFSPDGARVSYAAHDYRSDPATRILDTATGRITTLARRNQFGWNMGPAAWLPDGDGLIVAQLEYRDRFRLYGDLWRIDADGRERRLTRGERLAQPDVAPDGRRVAAVRTHDGAIDLVEHDLRTGQTRLVAAAAPGQAFHAPRWSPSGDALAAARFADGQLDVVLVDPATGAVVPVTDDQALAGAPAWSPDGRWLLFWSDRTGVPNLFAAPIRPDGTPDPGGVRQVTNVLGGAFDPDVAPDGRAIAFSSYRHGGWRLERMPFDTTAWQPAPPPRVRHADGLLAAPGNRRGAGNATPDAAATGGESRPYPALAGARPRFWVPTYQVVGNDFTGQWSRFIGAYTMGWDVLQRHSWQAAAAYDVRTGRVALDAAWSWSGVPNLPLTIAVDRDWSGVGRIQLPDGRDEAVLLREDRLALGATLWRRQWRSTAWLGATADIRGEQFQALDLSDADLREAGIAFRTIPTRAGISVRPAFSNVRQHPYSISRQDGLTASLGLGRWWNLDDAAAAYDELTAALAGYRGHRLWGFADHVAAARVATRLRTGDEATAFSIAGAPGPGPDLLLWGTAGGTFLPVRGFRSGDRAGTRAWAASAEYRFPIFLAGDPGRVLGLSLTSAAGALFADAGNAWCAPAERDSLPGCADRVEDPLASVGAEMSVTIGVMHGTPVALRYGLAVPLSGPRHRAVTFHVGFGPSF